MTIETPSLNRRRLLIGLAAASTAAAVPVAAIAATAPAQPAENPELVRLGDMIPGAVKAYYASVSRMHRIVASTRPVWPMAPKEAVADWPDRHAWETNVEGREILPDGTLYQFDFAASEAGRSYPKPRTLIAASDLESRIARLDRDRVRRRPKHPLTAEQLAELRQEITALSDRLAVVRAYEQEKARVLEASGYADAKAAYVAKRTALLDLLAAVMSEPVITMEGLVIKAQALAVVKDDHLRSWSFTLSLKGTWLTGYAADVLSIAEAQASA
jgi:hypothetical protein